MRINSRINTYKILQMKIILSIASLIYKNNISLYKHIILFFIPFLLLFCTKSENLATIIEVAIAHNYLSQHPDSVLYLDYQDAYYKGFVIPSIRQTPNGKFDIILKIKPKDLKKNKLYYKIYYQNETYKFDENNPLAYENFYGSWDDTLIGFKEVNTNGIIKDSFQIVGNPRNEQKYYGESIENPKVTIEAIKEQMLKVRNSIEWYASTKEKAIKNKLSIENQMYLEAKWYLSNQKSEDKQNNRWKRNPRVGKYSMLIVIADETGLNEIPYYIKYINKTHPEKNIFVNPYNYFLYGDGKKSKHLQCFIQPSFIKVKANPDIKQGIYVNAETIENPNIKSIFSRNDCGNNNLLYKNANFEQFFHAYIRTTVLSNIPIAYDVVNGNYTRDNYNSNALKYEEKQRVNDYINISDCPCKTVAMDTLRNAIHIFNPANPKLPYTKENVGVKTRNGLTYGKYRLKIKFPPQLSKDNVWNGITNAFWLLHQSLADWNKRRICENTGYIGDGEGANAIRQKESSYSEIDIEIVKTSPFWPQTSYKNQSKIPFKEEKSAETDNIVIALTNWDLACKDAKNFNKGVHQISYQNQDFVLHRWDDWYKALTIRNAIKHSDLYNHPYYFFEIEWKPEEIIWRIGPEPDKLTVIGYMNSSVTNIPNNQMVAVITQEFHHDWWPPQPYSQKNIPYPKNSIDGWIYELEIE